jgi:uncharacterized membrane protein
VSSQTKSELLGSWRGIHQSPEWPLFLWGLRLSALYLLLSVLAALIDPNLTTTLLVTLGLHFLGARGPGILLCLAQGIPPLPTVLLNFLAETIVVLLGYPFLLFAMRDGLRIRWLQRSADQAKKSASINAKRLERWGLLGLFFFVMFPFAMTGPVMGCVIGHLLGTRLARTLVVSLAGTFCALVVYVYAGEWLLTLIKDQTMLLTLVGVFVLAGLILKGLRSLRKGQARSLAAKEDEPMDG